MHLYYAQSQIACVPFAQSRKRNQKRFSAPLQRPTRNGQKDETEKLAGKIAQSESADKLKHVSVFFVFSSYGCPVREANGAG